MSRYYITVELEHPHVTGPQVTAVTARLCAAWPFTAVIARPAGSSTRTNVVHEFAGPADAMFVLGVVMNAFETAGVPVTFQSVSISAVQHEHSLTVEDLARND